MAGYLITLSLQERSALTIGVVCAEENYIGRNVKMFWRIISFVGLLVSSILFYYNVLKVESLSKLAFWVVIAILWGAILIIETLQEKK